MNDSPANRPAAAENTVTRRLYLPTVLAALFLLIVISITIWAGNTLTMITAMARFERTHTVSRVEAVAAFLDYQDDKKSENLETFHQKMATTQSYNKVFSRLLEMRKDTTDAEFVRILESTFSETDHPTAVIIVNRIKVLYWHPILKELVADAIGAHAAGETLKLQVTQFLATNDALEKKAILVGIHKTRKEFIVYETSFSKSCSDLANQISSYVTYLTIALLIISVGFISFLTYQIAKNILRRMAKDTLALRMTRFSIENASDAMYWMTPEARIVDVNDAACRLLGYARPDLLELSVPDVDAHYDAAQWPGHFAELRQRGSMIFESEQRHRDGHLIPVEVVANYVKFGEEERNCAFVRDITARKQAEQERSRREDSFQRQNSLLSTLLKTLPIGVFMVEAPSGTPLVANEVACELLGRGILPNVSKENLSEVYNSYKMDTCDQYPLEEMPIIRGMNGESSHVEDMMVKRPDGTQSLLEVFGSPVLDDQGQVWASLVSFLDITGRKQAEKALRVASLYSRSLIETSLDALVTISAEGKITDVNLATEKTTGVSRERLLGSEFSDYFTEPDLARAGYQQVFAQGQVIDYPLAIRHTSGTITEVLYNASVYRDEHGAVLGVFAAARDITVRKRAEEALQLSEQKFRALFENLSEGVALHELVMDAAGAAVDYRLLAVNPAYETHTGLAAATAPGLLGTQLYGTEVPPYLMEFSRVALGGVPYAFDTFFPPLEKHFRISVISPRPGQFATVFEDITERKCREQELQQKNEEMERFTYMISHDLKSPLVTVRTFLGYLEQDLESGKAERVAKDMGFIRDATGKMGRLLEDLLEVSRVGRVENPSVRVRLGDLIQEALTAVAGAIATRGVAIQVEVPAVTLYGDRPRLEEIWQNLVENAVKYMGGQAAPRIELGVEEAGTDLVFFVRDNGLGIDPRFQDKVFGLFEKLDPASEGTGLGLALVKRIVELYQGRIWVESEGLGRGTCFRFTLPQALKNRKQGA